MTILHKIRRLKSYTWQDRGLLFEAVAMLAVAQLLVKYVPFSLWSKKIGKIGKVSQSDPDCSCKPVQDNNVVIARKIGRIVLRAANHVPFAAVCLPQAMAARWMLQRRHVETDIYIGVRSSDTNREFAFHAWLMFGNHCLTGAKERETFSAFD